MKPILHRQKRALDDEILRQRLLCRALQQVRELRDARLWRGPDGRASGKSRRFCSDWCIEWAGLRDGAEGLVRLPIPRPAPVERSAAPDMVMMNILDSTMVSICREMGILLMKTSYSTIFNEGLDFTCALADAKGDMIACAEFCPTMIGGCRCSSRRASRRSRTRTSSPAT
ncbi:MAG: hydantoinase B/oxoprolinase family protein [Geminicoccaceae bacterium]